MMTRRAATSGTLTMAGQVGSLSRILVKMDYLTRIVIMMSRIRHMTRRSMIRVIGTASTINGSAARGLNQVSTLTQHAYGTQLKKNSTKTRTNNRYISSIRLCVNRNHNRIVNAKSDNLIQISPYYVHASGLDEPLLNFGQWNNVLLRNEFDTLN